MYAAGGILGKSGAEELFWRCEICGTEITDVLIYETVEQKQIEA